MQNFAGPRFHGFGGIGKPLAANKTTPATKPAKLEDGDGGHENPRTKQGGERNAVD